MSLFFRFLSLVVILLIWEAEAQENEYKREKDKRFLLEELGKRLREMMG